MRNYENTTSLIQRVKHWFLSGNQGTAIQINSECFTGDARKVISDLRAHGWNIRDVRVRGLQKLYWLDHEQRASLIKEGGGHD